MNTRDVGNKGETFAREYLQQQGYRVLRTNYRVRSGEIDIIAKDKDMVVFVEVKTRAEEGWDAFEAVNPRKQRKLYRVAEQYLLETYNTVDVDGRFDVLAVRVQPDGSFQGDLLKDAFHR